MTVTSEKIYHQFGKEWSLKFFFDQYRIHQRRVYHTGQFDGFGNKGSLSAEADDGQKAFSFKSTL